ncbi:hypothetical protein [Mycobacterium sp. 050134]|uniref:hypothetical protein n=1 Tax=Mycobacterium sp. 050134 TaxID=3096111 RepID=UPI002ED86844
MTIVGEWDVTIKTPIGSLAVTYSFSPVDGRLDGTAILNGETTPVQDILVDGGRVTWRQSVSKPMRLNLEFDVVVEGDELSGHSRAGRLPRSKVTGRRNREGPRPQRADGATG